MKKVNWLEDNVKGKPICSPYWDDKFRRFIPNAIREGKILGVLHYSTKHTDCAESCELSLSEVETYVYWEEPNVQKPALIFDKSNHQLFISASEFTSEEAAKSFFSFVNEVIHWPADEVKISEEVRGLGR